ncbi:MAG: hypothetical protein CM15mP103_09390 [Gammaproteobacteria bacterium]|nr:MAG: hypothetical protein CM15mP103_09390 [Gammaproteobacteria bacterium]
MRATCRSAWPTAATAHPAAALSQSDFLLAKNQDPMVSEKLSDGIRRFPDQEKLEALWVGNASGDLRGGNQILLSHWRGGGDTGCQHARTGLLKGFCRAHRVLHGCSGRAIQPRIAGNSTGAMRSFTAGPVSAKPKSSPAPDRNVP